MAEDFNVLYAPTEHERDSSKLRGVLEIHVRVEHARGIQHLAVGLVVGLSLPVWLAAVGATWMAEGLRTFVLAAWFVAFTGLVLAAVSTWRWRRRFDQLTTRPPNR